MKQFLLYRYLLLIILSFVLCPSIYGQNTEVPNSGQREIVTPIKFKTSKERDLNLKKRLFLLNKAIEYLTIPEIHTLELEGLENVNTKELVCVKNQTRIYLIDSYDWDLNEQLPIIPKCSVIKALLKNKDNVTDEEWKLLKYMEFYSGNYTDNIKYIINSQEFEVDKNLTKVIEYKFEYNAQGELFLSNTSIE
ncbi:hypothetical protein [Saccharicrinis aurantiacus]|uniref:hypothetical protein n=1 Tax=Saccharicrinis aurantiacus TaxID=1849719 RepID=UPI0024937E72|nr:hypothetical protein [Saccharicrinis aurantiacus]